jgi:hypothetical protein
MKNKHTSSRRANRTSSSTPNRKSPSIPLNQEQEMGIPIFMRPDGHSGLKEPKKLNHLAHLFRNTEVFAKIVSREGFDIHPIHFDWEYHVNFIDKNGFLVFREGSNDIEVYVYPNGDEILTSPNVLIRNFSTSDNQRKTHATMISSFMNNIYKNTLK